MKHELFLKLSETLVDTRPIERDLIELCFASNDPDAMGIAYDVITDQRQVSRINPAIAWEDAHRLVRIYYLLCIENDYENEWADSRLSAILDCEKWINATVPDMSKPERTKWLAWVRDLAEMDSDAAHRIGAQFGPGALEL